VVAGTAGARRCPGLRPTHRAAGGPDTPAYATPARVADPAGLPPAYIEVAQLDMFRDEDLAYALSRNIRRYRKPGSWACVTFGGRSCCAPGRRSARLAEGCQAASRAG
jgi:hypothetical protein